jgi:SWI/SNF-related matrix-associated actin-dependent regulator 1 of chromatin subfamily A
MCTHNTLKLLRPLLLHHRINTIFRITFPILLRRFTTLTKDSTKKQTKWVRLKNGKYIAFNDDQPAVVSGRYKPIFDFELCNYNSELRASLTVYNIPKSKKKIVQDAINDLFLKIKTLESITQDDDITTYYFNITDYQKILEMVTEISQNILESKIISIPQFVLDALPHLFQHVHKDVSVSDLAFLPSHMSKSLMLFQRQGIYFGIHECQGRVFIGDEMGLGKTVQALGIAYYYKKEWPLLIVCPSALRINWKNEIMKWLPDISEEDINIVETAAADDIEMDQYKVHIISYDLLARDDMLQRIKKRKKFRVIICDESHFLKSSTTKRTKAARPLIRLAKRAILMSGTATPSRPLELYDQLKALFTKKIKMNKTQYGARYCDLKMTHFGANYKGASHLNELNAIITRLGFIRRLKADVLSQLPPKIRQHIYLPTKMVMTMDQSGDDFLTNPSMQNIQLFKKTGMAKLDLVRAYIRDKFLTNGSDDKFLIFAHHKHVMDGIEQELVENRTEFIRIDGETPSNIREDLANHFRTNEKCRVALLSITVAGTGLTFVPCFTVVFAELFWNPGTLQQAEDRVHRIGQVASCVDIHYLLGQGTLDEFIWPLIMKKLSIIGKTLDGQEQRMDVVDKS